jgi:hypothetical protein
MLKNNGAPCNSKSRGEDDRDKQGTAVAHQKRSALLKISHKIGESIHHKKSSCAQEFSTRAIKIVNGWLRVENPLGLSPLVHNFGEICICHCIDKHQVDHMHETIHGQKD